MVKDNQQLRQLFTLPPIKESASTSLAVPEMPPQKTVTGDLEIDAVLWLQSVVKTGNQTLIDRALEAAKRITTPMNELGKRYADYIVRTTGNTLGAAFASFGFGDLEGQAKRAVEQAASRHEALSRFGTVDALFASTPAEEACIAALRRCKRRDKHWYDDAAAMARFNKRPALAPATIGDCLYVRAYWSKLYWLRAATDPNGYGDSTQECHAHDWYCRDMLAHLTPRGEAEAVAAFDHLNEDGGTDWESVQPIIRNLIASGWKAVAKEVA